MREPQWGLLAERKGHVLTTPPHQPTWLFWPRRGSAGDGQTEMQRARLWERPLGHLSGLDDNMGVWVPDAVLDTHSILCTRSLGHRCHDDRAHFRDEQTKVETVTHLHSHLRTMYLDP